MGKWLSEIKDFFDLRTDVIVTFCIASGLIIWKIELSYIGPLAREISTLVFVVNLCIPQRKNNNVHI